MILLLSGRLYHNGPRHDGKRLAQACDAAVERVVRRAQVHQKHLVVVVGDDAGQIRAEDRQFARVELAEKDRELRVVAAAFEQVEDLGSPLIVGDVVGNQVVPAGGHRVVTPT